MMRRKNDGVASRRRPFSGYNKSLTEIGSLFRGDLSAGGAGGHHCWLVALFLVLGAGGLLYFGVIFFTLQYCTVNVYEQKRETFYYYIV